MAELLFNTEEERRQAELLQAEIKKLEQQINELGNNSAGALKPLIESLTKLQKQFVGLTDNAAKAAQEVKTMQAQKASEAAQSKQTKEKIGTEIGGLKKNLDPNAANKEIVESVSYNMLDEKLFSFFDTDQLGTALKKVKEDVNKAFEDGKIDFTKAGTIFQKIEKAEKELLTKNPFKALKIAYDEYTSSNSEELAVKNFKSMAAAAQGSFSLISSSLGSVSKGMTDMGITNDKQSQGVMNSCVQIAGGFADIASMNPGQMVKGLMSVVTGVFSIGDAIKQAKIDKLIEQLNELGKAYNEIEKAAAKAYSSTAAREMEKANKNLEAQQVNLKKQKELEDSKKKTDKSVLTKTDDEIEALGKKIEENKLRMVDMLTGTDMKSAIDRFANAWVDAWGAGEDKAKSVANAVKSIVKGAILALAKDKVKPAVEAFQNALALAMKDGVLTAEEKADLKRKEADIVAHGEMIDESMGEFLTDDPSGGAQTAKAASNKGFAAMSQETGSALDGRFAVMQGYMEQTAMMSTLLTPISETGRFHLSIADETRTIAVNTFMEVRAIRDNTDRIVKPIIEMNQKMDVMNSRLDRL